MILNDMDYHLCKIKLMTYKFCTMKKIKKSQKPDCAKKIFDPQTGKYN